MEFKFQMWHLVVWPWANNLTSLRLHLFIRIVLVIVGGQWQKPAIILDVDYKDIKDVREWNAGLENQTWSR